MIYGIEAIKLYMPPPSSHNKIDTNIKEEIGRAQEKLSIETDATMTSVERYRQEWKNILKDLSENPECLRDLAFNGELKTSKFRSIHWALLLRTLSPDHRTWKEQRAQQRNRYEKLKEEFVKNPHDAEANDLEDDPLSQSTQSVWNQYFSDQELFAVIKQDVIRTFPGVDFFRKVNIQNAMTNILFYYAREHPYMCYRQGMHEILAPILFVMYGDHQALLHFKEITKTDIDETLFDVLNPDYLEADSYSIFSRVMSSIESYYRISNFVPTTSGYVPVQNSKTAASTEVEIISQLNSIRDKILAKEDLHLHNYLLKLDISLHIFGIRWLRLLFGREFALLDLLVLWDAIFADSDRFELPNYVLVAMLIRIRDKLLLSDYTTSLTYLMRYPANVDINLILRHALHMQMPKKFERPPNAIVYFTMKPPEKLQELPNSVSVAKAKSASSTSRIPQQQTSNSSALKHTTMTVATTTTTTPKEQSLLMQERTRTNPISLSDTAAVEKRIQQLQFRNAADHAAMDRLKLLGTENDRTVMDGYSENSPELMRLELANVQAVITVARSKLQTYLGVARKHFVKCNSEELAQSLDGIEELCQFLDVKFMFPLQTRIAPIDSADEANEQQQNIKLRKDKNAKKVNCDENNANDAVASLNTTTATTTVINSVTPNNAKDPTKSKSKLANVGSAAGNPDVVVGGANAATTTTYEKSDYGFMLNSARKLGNLKEIELIPIVTDEKIEHFSAESSATNGSNAQLATTNRGLPIVDPLKPQQIQHQQQENQTIP